MANRIVEVFYRLRDLFTGPAKRIGDAYGGIRRDSRATADAVKRDNLAAAKSFGAFSSAVSVLRGKFALFFTGAVIAKVAAQAHQLANEIDRLSKLGQRLNIDVNTLNGFAYAAERSGVSVSTMESALENLQVKTGEAVQGTGEAAEAFRRLGINVDDFIKLDAEQKLFLLAEAFAAVESQERRAALSAKLFSEANGEILNVLQNGSGPLAELATRGREQRHLTDDMAQAASDFKDTVEDTSAAVDGVGYKLGGSLLAAFNRVVQSFGYSTNELKNLQTQITNTKQLLEFGDAIGADWISDEAQRRLFVLYGRLDDFNKKVGESKAVQAEQRAALKASADANAEYEKSVERLTAAYEGHVKAAKATLAEETAELKAARAEQVSVEQEFAQLRESVTTTKKEDVTGLDVQAATLEARRKLAAGDAEGAINAARQGGDLLKQLHEQGEEAGYVLSFLAKGLEEVAVKASQKNVDAELIDAEQAQAGLDNLTGKMQVFTSNAATLGVQAGQAFVAAFQAELNTEITPPRVARSPSSAPLGEAMRRELNRRGGEVAARPSACAQGVDSAARAY